MEHAINDPKFNDTPLCEATRPEQLILRRVRVQTQDTTMTIRELRSALAWIAGLAEGAAEHTADAALAATLADIRETADRALFEDEERDYEAWRAEQPASMATVAADLPY